MKPIGKQILALLLVLVTLCASAVCFAEETAEPELGNVGMALLYEESTDTILYTRGEDALNEPASMTKVMTAILVLEHNPDLSGSFTVPAEAVSPEYCYWMEDVHLLEGETLTIRQLMDYLLIASGNEAGTTLAAYVAGDIPTFVDMMNAKAAELGMTDTYYADPHGLSTKSKISARDMLTLSRYAMQNELFREIVSTKSGRIPGNAQRKVIISYANTNRVMNPRSVLAYETEFTDDVIGIKTGYISEAGYNLASCMVKDDLTFYSVVMEGVPVQQSEDSTLYGHYLDTIELFTYARTFEKQGITAGSVITTAQMEGSSTPNLPLAAAEDVYILVQEGRTLEQEVVLDPIGRSVTEGQQLGKVVLRDAFGNARETALLATETIEIPSRMPLFIGGGVAVAAVAALVTVLAVRKKRGAAAVQADAAQQGEAVEQQVDA